MDLVQCFQNTLELATLIPQTDIFGILNSRRNKYFFENNKVFANYILLILKFYVYKSREKKIINVNNLIVKFEELKGQKKKLL